MSLGRRTSTRQALRQLSTSKPNQSESQPSPSETTRENTKPQPQAQSKSHVQQHSASHDSSDDEILVPIKLSTFTKALLNDGQPEPSAVYAILGERPAPPSAQPPPRVCTRRRALAASTSSTSKDRGHLRESVRQREIGRDTRADSLQLPPAKPTSPAASQSRGSSPAPRKRVVRLSYTPGRGTPQNGLRRFMSASAQRTRAESGNRSIGGESHFQTQAEMDERHPKQEYAQTSINSPISSVRTVRISIDSSGQRIRSAGSSAISSKRFGADSDAGTPENPATAERANAADNVGSVSRTNNSGKREDLELRSTTRLKRVIRVSGSLLSGPARRGRRRQTEEDAEAHGEESLTAAQDPESQQAQDLEPAAIDQPAMALSTSKLHNSTALGSPFQTKHPIPAAIGKQASPVRLFNMHAQQTASHNESPHHELIPLPEILSVHAKEIQAPAPASFRRASIKPLDKELSKPSRPLSLDTGSVAPQRALISERRALAVKSQNTPYRPAPSLPPPKMSVVETVTATQWIKKRQLMRVNGRAYTRIGFIGRGGSGKVYRVATESGTTLALKRVSLVHTDELTIEGLRREIELLQRLRDIERVIQLIDFEMNREKQSLCILMELGELDFNSLLKNRQSGAEAPSFDIAFVRYYWKEMLECVQAIHAQAVVHSDLKPANFVLVKGRLKLIDFGIANAIQTDMTINVHRETMAGTLNYMSPESLMDSNQYALMSIHNGHSYIPASGAPKVVKVGKPSDVWSLGCILYQMVYGMPPFGKIAEPRLRIHAIVDWSSRIGIPATTEDGSRVPVALIQTMRRCLSRDQKDRPTCETLLSEGNDFLYPKEYNPALSAAGDGKILPMTEELLGRVIQSVVLRCKGGTPADDMALAAWPSAYWASLMKAVARPTP
ncbi:kinase-like protein [Durotheca rogersii]|uniref:kinase-like protein n=1 Tax=Durotheca rogersii TaxID=419775 RepID=UPI0022211BFB|nr:kinase-like protein [Durotheca rogersii]KAI5861723.1 kinase-like protein [Durotheca rogersii]